MAFKHVSLYLTLLVSVQVCLAGPTTTPAPFTLPTFAELLTNAQKSINEAASHVQHMLGMPEVKNVDQIVAVVKNASVDFTKKVNDVLTTVKTEVDPNAKAAAAAFQKFYSEVNKTATELAKKVPELQSTDVEKVFTKSLSSIVEEGNKLRAALEKEAPHAQESLTKAAQNIIDSAVKAANSFATQVHETVGHNNHPDHAKHHKA
nr:PREDICTED: uncharacterized protein LOC109043666 isoform X2 [Bemisia tabaci]